MAPGWLSPCQSLLKQGPRLDSGGVRRLSARPLSSTGLSALLHAQPTERASQGSVMKIRNSLRAAKVRDKNCRVVRRRGRVYVINKKNPRMKARQG